ncbi:MAG: TonB family protein, partial [Sideroxydans sp.]
KVETPQAKSADIELREKKISKVEPAKPTAKELKERKQAEEQRLLEEYAEKRRQALQETMRAEIAAATSAEVGRYQDMIRSKIRRNIVGIPPDLPADAKAEFKVTVLPGGMVMDVQLVKSSGNRAYDDAAERAIFKAQPLPLPTDVGLQKLFRELRLTIKPQE